MLKRYFNDRSGQGMSEYLILVLLIAVGSIAVSQKVGRTVIDKFGLINENLDREVTLKSVREKQ